MISLKRTAGALLVAVGAVGVLTGVGAAPSAVAKPVPWGWTNPDIQVQPKTPVSRNTHTVTPRTPAAGAPDTEVDSGLTPLIADLKQTGYWRMKIQIRGSRGYDMAPPRPGHGATPRNPQYYGDQGLGTN